MTNFSTDADLLKWEPELFRQVRVEGQRLVAGGSGSTTAGSATLTDSGADFEAAGVGTGHVVHVTKSGVYDLYLPVAGLTGKTVMVLAAPAGLFTTQNEVAYEVHTFDPQHEEAHFELCRRFEVSEDAQTDFGPTRVTEVRVLRRAGVFRVLEGLFRGQATGVEDLFWQKAVFYGSMYASAVSAAKVGIDRDGDGSADVTRTGHSVRLKVEEAGDKWRM